MPDSIRHPSSFRPASGKGGPRIKSGVTKFSIRLTAAIARRIAAWAHRQKARSMRPFPLLSASVFALAAALTLPNGAPSQAQPARRAAAAPQVPSQLPRNVRPLHYRIAAPPDAANLRFTGRVEIDIEVLQPTDRITLNAAEL